MPLTDYNITLTHLHKNDYMYHCRNTASTYKCYHLQQETKATNKTVKNYKHTPPNFFATDDGGSTTLFKAMEKFPST